MKNSAKGGWVPERGRLVILRASLIPPPMQERGAKPLPCQLPQRLKWNLLEYRFCDEYSSAQHHHRLTEKYCYYCSHICVCSHRLTLNHIVSQRNTATTALTYTNALRLHTL